MASSSAETPKVLTLSTPSQEIPIYLGSGLVAEFARWVTEVHPGGHIVFMSSPKIAQLHLNPFRKALEADGHNVSAILFNDREDRKRLPTVEVICDQLARIGADRDALLIGLGGGVVTDVAGFVASIFMRGVAYINVPTTLLAQCDAAVGGKTGVNLDIGKNQVGTFYQPLFVASDVQLLETLAVDEFKNAFGEIVKYGVIHEPAILDDLEEMHELVRDRDADLLLDLIERCLRIKIGLVSEDEHDTGQRRLLNFGHTVGHAIEASSTSDLLKHGFCVGLGMLAETSMAVDLGICEPALLERLEALLDLLELPRAAKDIEVEEVYERMRHDKKNHDAKLTFVLPERPGSMIIRDDVPEEAVRKALDSVIIDLSW